MKKIAIVTGASRGLGFATSIALAERGFKVVMRLRNTEKAQRQLNELRLKDLVCLNKFLLF